MDERLLLAINQGWGSPVSDGLFVWLSSHGAFSLPLCLLILAFMVWRFGVDGIKFCLFIVLAIGIGEQLGVFLKEYFSQARPCAELGERLREVKSFFPVNCSYSLHGMPSNHAIEYFVLAAYTGMILRWPLWWVIFLSCAALVSLSRIYLGLHYPSQVLAGAVIGCLVGSFLASLSVRYLPAIQRVRQVAHRD